MATFYIRPNHIAAIATFQAHKDRREYLNGVRIEPLENGKVLLAATDGHTLGALAHASDTWNGTPEPLIVKFPKPMLTRFGSATGRDGWVTIDAEANVVTFTTRKGVQTTFPLETHDEAQSPYPVWRRIVPTDIPEAASETFHHYNPEYLARFAKARAALGSNGPVSLLPRGVNSTVVLMPDVPEFIGVLMPMRGEAPSALPSITRIPVAKKEQPETA